MKKGFKMILPILLLALGIALYSVRPVSKMDKYDVAKSWAAEDMFYWSERGVITALKGRLRPDDGVTASDLATVFTRLLPLEEKAENVFDDVPEGSWYEEAILKCVAAGILGADGETELRPMEYLTREEALVLFARAFSIEPAAGETFRHTFNDAFRVSDRAAPYVEALFRQGLIVGENPVQLTPERVFTRAEMVTELSAFREAGYLT